MRNSAIKVILSGLLLVVASSVLFSQSGKIAKAQQMMERLQYQDAYDLYKKLWYKNPENPAFLRALAHSSGKLGDMETSRRWYGQLTSLPEATAADKYNYARTLLANEQCELAREWFALYLVEQPDDVHQEILLDPCSFRSRLLNPDPDWVLHPVSINTEGNEFGAAFFSGGLVFAAASRSKRKRNAFLDLYYTTSLETLDSNGYRMFQPVEVFSEVLNGPTHEGIVTFDAEERRVFFTRNQKVIGREQKSEVIRLEILYSERIGDSSWTKPMPLPFNNTEYSVAHPALMPDGEHLLFSSDMPGGFGGKDLYMVQWRDGFWGVPENLGPSINTSGDELFPFVAANGQLYFSSDGHLGMGGQDMYLSTQDKEGNWLPATNLGVPFNSSADDFGLFLAKDQQTGYFTSNRDGGQGGDDLYELRRREESFALVVQDDDTGAILPGAKVRDLKSDRVYLADGEGKISFPLGPEDCTLLSASIDGYFTDTMYVCGARLRELEGRPGVIGLLEVKEFVLIGRVFDKETNLPLKNATVNIKVSNCGNTNVDVRTDHNGIFKYNTVRGCCCSLEAYKYGYKSIDYDRPYCIKDKNYTLPTLYLEPVEQIVVAQVTPEPAPVRKVVPRGIEEFTTSERQEEGAAPAYLLEVYYDLGRSSVREASVQELFKLQEFLALNPDLKVEIGSHTDAQGKRDYNQTLSQKRADNIVRYLVSTGIARDRLTAIGYGESLPVNHCIDGVDCTDDEHQQNRRTEFRILE